MMLPVKTKMPSLRRAPKQSSSSRCNTMSHYVLLCITLYALLTQHEAYFCHTYASSSAQSNAASATPRRGSNSRIRLVRTSGCAMPKSTGHFSRRAVLHNKCANSPLSIQWVNSVAFFVRGGSHLDESESDNDMDVDHDAEDKKSHSGSEDEEEGDTDSSSSGSPLSSESEDEYGTESEDEGNRESSSGQQHPTASDGELKVYDEPLKPNAVRNLLATMGVMMYTRRFDRNDPKVVKFARILFISYMIVVQIFLGYVRIRARLRNDRTPITIENPMANIVKTQLNSAVSGKAGGHEETVKSLADRFLSSQSTVMEYDMAQANQMRNGLLFPLIAMWIMHFKFGQVQPLFMEVARGVMAMMESCLFQVYVLGLNLERPFKVPNPLAELQKARESQENVENVVTDDIKEEAEGSDSQEFSADDEGEDEDLASSDDGESDDSETDEDCE